MRIVVDLPEPFGPRKPRTSPRSTLNETPSTALLAPKVFTRFSIRIIDWPIAPPAHSTGAGVHQGGALYCGRNPLNPQGGTMPARATRLGGALAGALFALA